MKLELESCSRCVQYDLSVWQLLLSYPQHPWTVNLLVLVNDEYLTNDTIPEAAVTTTSGNTSIYIDLTERESKTKFQKPQTPQTLFQRPKTIKGELKDSKGCDLKWRNIKMANDSEGSPFRYNSFELTPIRDAMHLKSPRLTELEIWTGQQISHGNKSIMRVMVRSASEKHNSHR